MRPRARVALGATIAAAICTAALLDPAAGHRHGASEPPVRTFSAAPNNPAPATRPAAPPLSLRPFSAGLPDPAPATRPDAFASPAGVLGGGTACTASREVSIGAGVSALLTLSPAGPRVAFKDGPGRPLPGLGTLDRAHPAAPPSAGIRAEILTPYGTAPRLRTKVEGGAAAPYQLQNFPRLPRGCALKGVEAPAA